MKINRWRLPLVVGSVVVLAAAIAVGVGVLIAHDRSARPSPVAFASQSPTMSAAELADPHGAKACELNNEAYDAEQLQDDAIVLRISHEADQSDSPAIRAGADEVVGQQVKAKSGEVADVLGLMTASLKMRTACIYEGLLPKV